MSSSQLLYEAVLCIWLLSFYDGAVDAFSTARVLPRLVDVVKLSTKEKVLLDAVFELSEFGLNFFSFRLRICG